MKNIESDRHYSINRMMGVSFQQQPQPHELVNDQVSADDWRCSLYWRGVLAELLGSSLLHLLAYSCWQVLHQHQQVGSSDVVLVGGVYAVSWMSMSWTLLHLSAGHLNPALTAACLLTRKVKMHKAALYILVQCCGSIVAAGVIYGLIGHKPLLISQVSASITPLQGLIVEMLCTFTFVFVWFAERDCGRQTDYVTCQHSALTLFTVHALAMPLTMCGVNPAKSLGAAIISGHWHNQWVYCLGPLVGGIVSGLTYDVFFASNSSVQRCWALVVDPHYDTTRMYPDHSPVNTNTPTSSPLRRRKMGADSSSSLTSSSHSHYSSSTPQASPIHIVEHNHEKGSH